jgi:putative flippase GtrA
MSAVTFEHAVSRLRQTYFSKEFLLFVFCGGMGTLTNFLCSLAISWAINPSVAYTVGYALSLLVAYALNVRLIFHRHLSAATFARFIVSYLPNFCILFAFVLIFLNVLGWNKVIVYALAGLLGLPVTFLLVKLMVFRQKKGEQI